MGRLHKCLFHRLSWCGVSLSGIARIEYCSCAFTVMLFKIICFLLSIFPWGILLLLLGNGYLYFSSLSLSRFFKGVNAFCESQICPNEISI